MLVNTIYERDLDMISDEKNIFNFYVRNGLLVYFERFTKNFNDRNQVSSEIKRKKVDVM